MPPTSVVCVEYSCVAACVLEDQHQKGNIFTLFLHSPLMAFCHIVNIVDVPVSLWDKCLTVVDKFIADASRLLSRSRTLGRSRHAY